MSETVVRCVADARGVRPSDLATPLQEAVDPDGIDRLFADRGGPTPPMHGHVVFTWSGCEVVIHGSGAVVVTVPGE